MTSLFSSFPPKCWLHSVHRAGGVNTGTTESPFSAREPRLFFLLADRRLPHAHSPPLSSQSVRGLPISPLYRTPMCGLLELLFLTLPARGQRGCVINTGSESALITFGQNTLSCLNDVIDSSPKWHGKEGHEVAEARVKLITSITLSGSHRFSSCFRNTPVTTQESGMDYRGPFMAAVGDGKPGRTL